jgi:hypothetical protein
MKPDALQQLLVPEKALRAQRASIRTLVAPLAPQVAFDIDNPRSGEALQNYQLFSDPDLVRRACLTGLDDVSTFYNRYYWMLRFKALQPYDAGLDQQAQQLLEYAPSEVDFSIVEAIEKLADEVDSKG